MWSWGKGEGSCREIGRTGVHRLGPGGGSVPLPGAAELGQEEEGKRSKSMKTDYDEVTAGMERRGPEPGGPPTALGGAGRRLGGGSRGRKGK